MELPIVENTSGDMRIRFVVDLHGTQKFYANC